MSLHEYKVSQEISVQDYPFYALIMACFRKADTHNLGKLRRAFPFVFQEFLVRYNAPGGLLEDELPETIMGMPVKVTEACPNAWTLVLQSFNEYDHREDQLPEGELQIKVVSEEEQAEINSALAAEYTAKYEITEDPNGT